MKKLIALIALAAVLTLPLAEPAASATRRAPAKSAPKVAVPAIPYYPGGQVEVEVSLTKDDLLPVLLQFVGKFFEGAGPKLQSSPSLSNALSTVVGLYAVQMSVPGTADSQQVLGFYTRIPESKGMTRVFRQSDEEGNSILVWSGAGGKGLFGVRISSDDKPKKWRVQAGRLDGFVDFAAILKAVKFTMGTSEDGKSFKMDMKYPAEGGAEGSATSQPKATAPAGESSQPVVK